MSEPFSELVNELRDVIEDWKLKAVMKPLPRLFRYLALLSAV